MKTLYLLIADHGETDDLEGIFTTIENAKKHWENNDLEYVKECYILESIELDRPHSEQFINKMIYLK